MNNVNEIDFPQLDRDIATISESLNYFDSAAQPGRDVADDRFLRNLQIMLDSETPQEMRLLLDNIAPNARIGFCKSILDLGLPKIFTHINTENSAILINQLSALISGIDAPYTSIQNDPRINPEEIYNSVLDNKLKFANFANALSEDSLKLLTTENRLFNYSLFGGVFMDVSSDPQTVTSALEKMEPFIASTGSALPAINHLLSKDLLGYTNNFKRHYPFLRRNGPFDINPMPREFILVYSGNRRSPEVNGLLADFLNEMQNLYPDSFDPAGFMKSFIHHHAGMAVLNFTSFVSELSGKIDEEVIDRFIELVKSTPNNREKLLAAINHVELTRNSMSGRHRSPKI